MAYKADTFWERHPLPGGEGPYEPGLELVEVLDERRVLWSIAAVLLLVSAAVVLELYGGSWFAPALPDAIVPAWLILTAMAALRGSNRRYRLYAENRSEPELGGAPERHFGMLKQVLHSPALFALLAPPEPLYSKPSIFKNTFPELTALLSLYLIGGALMLLGGLLLFLLTPPYTLPDLLPILSVFLFFSVPLLFVWWIGRRISLGVQVLGTGDVQVDGDEPLARFDEVQRAELCCDGLLGRPYLRLDLYGTALRYYSPVSEPLHLLRLAKYRMPHLRLRVFGP